MASSPLLAPVVALVAWSLVMLLWMYATRFPAMRRAGISLKGRVGSRGADLDGAVDREAQWKAHNYNHLMEQPTLFYAIVFALMLMHFDAPINVWLAWGYVAFRIAHSIVQATVNVVRVRFLLFTLATLCLISLTVHAGLRLFYGG
jgi:hypothetical protein